MCLSLTLILGCRCLALTIVLVIIHTWVQNFYFFLSVMYVILFISPRLKPIPDLINYTDKPSSRLQLPAVQQSLFKLQWREEAELVGTRPLHTHTHKHRAMSAVSSYALLPFPHPKACSVSSHWSLLIRAALLLCPHLVSHTCTLYLTHARPSPALLTSNQNHSLFVLSFCLLHMHRPALPFSSLSLSSLFPYLSPSLWYTPPSSLC